MILNDAEIKDLCLTSSKNEGILQLLFLRGNECNNPYLDGKYQNQSNNITLAKM